MKLCTLQIELLKRTRETMGEAFDADPKAYEFICNVLEGEARSVVTGSRSLPGQISVRSIERACEALVNGISLALCGLPTLRVYLASFYDGFPDCASEMQRVTNLARLAWLDRIIDTGELV